MPQKLEFSVDPETKEVKQETKIKEALSYLEGKPKSNKKIINGEFSAIKQQKKNEVTPRSHG